MKTLDDYKDDVCEALGCDDRSDLHREHVSGCYNVEKLLEARDIEHRDAFRAETEAQDVEIERLKGQLRDADDANEMAAALIERLRGELGEATSILRAWAWFAGDEDRYAITAHRTRAFLASSSPATPTSCTASAGSCNSPKACGEAGRCIDARVREVVAPADSTWQSVAKNAAEVATWPAWKREGASILQELAAPNLAHPPVRCARCVERGFGRCDHDKSAPPDDIRELLSELSNGQQQHRGMLDKVFARLAAIEAKGEPGTHAFVPLASAPMYCAACPGPDGRHRDNPVHQKGAKP